MKRLTVLLLLLCATLTVTAVSITTASRPVGNTQRVASRIVSTSPCKLNAVMGYNGATNTQWLFVFEAKAAPTNGTWGRFGPFPIGATQFYSVDLSAYGADLDCVTVGVSTTDTTFTTAATNSATIQALISPMQ